MKSLYFERNAVKNSAARALGRMSQRFLFSGSVSPVVFQQDLPDPPLPAENWLRVKNLYTGICGTELSLFRGGGMDSALSALPQRDRVYLGHETVGEVLEAGPQVTDLQSGDRVVMMMNTPSCLTKGLEPPCRFCAQGDYALCERSGEPGPYDLNDTGAGMGDQYVAPRAQVFKIDDELSNDQAVLLEPLAVAVHGVLRRPPLPGEKVLINGCGTLGLLILSVLKALYPDTPVYLPAETHQRRLLALKFGADEVFLGDVYERVAKLTGGTVAQGAGDNRFLLGGGMDVIYDARGSELSTHNCLRWLRTRGTYVKIGYQRVVTQYDETPLWMKELTILGVNSHGVEELGGRKLPTFDLAQRLLLARRLPPVQELITHWFPLEQYKEAFTLLLEKASPAVKVVLKCAQPL